MKTILILGAGKEQTYAIKLANQKKIRTIVLDKNPKAEGAVYADEFYPISTRDVNQITEFLKGYNKKIDGVMTIASDIPHCVSTAAGIINVPHIPLQAAYTCIQKLNMKKVLRDGKVNVPDFSQIKSSKELAAFIADASYPVVIKPVDNSGARGVLRITKDTDLQWAFDYTKQFSYSGDILVEKFIDGTQISIEGLTVEDVFYCTGFADRNYERIEKTAPYLVEDGGDIPSILNSHKKEMVVKEFEKAARTLGINWGPAKGDMIDRKSVV